MSVALGCCGVSCLTNAFGQQGVAVPTPVPASTASTTQGAYTPPSSPASSSVSTTSAPPRVYKDSGWSPTPNLPKKAPADTQGKRVAPIMIVAVWFALVAAFRIFGDWRRKRIQARHVAEMEAYFRERGR